MDQGSGSGLFVNDGSFMKRFKKLEQQENPPPPPLSQDRETEEIRSNRATGAKSSETRRTNAPAAGGKLAFSLKPKAKIAIALVKLGGDEEEDGDEAGCSNDSSKRRKLSRMGTDESAVQHGDGGDFGGPSSSDPIAMMDYYMKKAAQEERNRPPKRSKDEMPPPASLQVPAKKGHHMGDYIPQEELDKFLSNCNDAAAQKAAREAAERATIQADNIGYKLLSKMGWKDGEGLGSDRSGRAEPVMVGNVKKDNLGVGAQQPGEVTPEDDIYEQYNKRMMLGYRFRPNPLGNPRKAYY